MKFHFIRTSWEGKFPVFIRPSAAYLRGVRMLDRQLRNMPRLPVRHQYRRCDQGPATKALNVYEVQEIEGGIQIRGLKGLR